MKQRDLRREKARSSFKSLYPYLVRYFSFSDSEIDFFLDHQVFNYRLYVCDCLCGVFCSFPSLVEVISISEFCYKLLEGHFLPF